MPQIPVYADSGIIAEVSRSVPLRLLAAVPSLQWCCRVRMGNVNGLPVLSAGGQLLSHLMITNSFPAAFILFIC